MLIKLNQEKNVKVKSKSIVKKINNIKDEKLNDLTINFDYITNIAIFKLETYRYEVVWENIHKLYEAYYFLFSENRKVNEYAYIFMCIDKSTDKAKLNEIKDSVTSLLVLEKMKNESKKTFEIELYDFILFLINKRCYIYV